MSHKTNSKSLCVIHLPTNVGGNPNGLSKALCKIGVLSEAWSLEESPLKYDIDKYIWKRNDSAIIREIKRFKALFDLLLRSDIAHYNFGRTLYIPSLGNYPSWKKLIKNPLSFIYPFFLLFMQNFELFFVKNLGKKIFVHFQGDDARQGKYCLENYENSIAHELYGDGYYSYQVDNHRRRQIIKLSMIAHKVFAVNPDLINILPEGAKFIGYCHINLEDWVPVPNKPHLKPEKKPIRIGHAPTHRKVKGTNHIINAIEQLKKEGYEIDFILIENLSNSEARKVYESLDILVDQLFAGWYGGLAVEVMALGVPVMAYIRESDLVNIPEQMVADLPIHNCCRKTIYHELKNVLKMEKVDIMSWGNACRLFVEKWHNPSVIAMTILNEYKKSKD